MHEPMSLAASSVPFPVMFTGSKRTFAKLTIRGGLLELITLGFYRFWLTTDMRRHLWSHTSVGGDPAEYTGRARELLIGFLIAMAILVPIWVGIFFVTVEAERAQEFASLPLFFLTWVLVQYAIYRARRYRVTRTVWRGLRFSMGGSGWTYTLRSTLWGVLTVLTLGIAWPWRWAALERYKMQNTAYGSLQGEFSGTGWQFFKRVWYLALLLPIGYFTAIGLPIVYAVYKSIEWRFWVSNVNFGDVSFECDLDWSDLIPPYFKVIGWSVLIGAIVFGTTIGIPYVSAIGFNASPTEEEIVALIENPLMIGGVVTGYLVFAVAIGVALRVYLLRDIWVKIAELTQVHNLLATEDISGQGVLDNALGEGFADGLDVGGF